ncbi:hypothetical protein CEXT_436261 [Caerostris extrusa]|uniref:Uncharacterized protein n=1 Tax=Caerostris extrusa TaxID=172846 RepID=A0AAV4MVU1_CAEEX|nr:hypothetical protein CEXT_436261 [Caerostris extrusa]
MLHGSYKFSNLSAPFRLKERLISNVWGGMVVGQEFGGYVPQALMFIGMNVIEANNFGKHLLEKSNNSACNGYSEYVYKEDDG